MTRSELEKIIPEESDQDNDFARGWNIYRSTCLDALVKAEIGVVPSKEELEDFIGVALGGKNFAYYPTERARAHKLALIIRALMLEGKG